VLGQSIYALLGFSSFNILIVLSASNQLRFELSLSTAESICFGVIFIILNWTIFLNSLEIFSLCIGVNNLESFIPKYLNPTTSDSLTITPAIMRGPITGPFGKPKRV